jgi:hypothetical protein
MSAISLGCLGLVQFLLSVNERFLAPYSDSKVSN